MLRRIRGETHLERRKVLGKRREFALPLLFLIAVDKAESAKIFFVLHFGGILFGLSFISEGLPLPPFAVGAKEIEVVIGSFFAVISAAMEYSGHGYIFRNVDVDLVETDY